MKKVISFLLDNRWLVVAMLLVLIAGGIYTMFQLPIEAFPDLTNNQVVVTVQCPGLSPVEVEQLVTYPIETSLMGMPKLQMVRSTSKLDLSMVTVIFDDSMDKYLVRQLVAERLNQVQSRIPTGLQPQIGPMATAFGEVYQYTVEAPKMSLMDIKTLHDWVIRYDLLTIPGVSEINSWGGQTKQYTIEVNPDSLRRYDLTLHDVVTAVSSNNDNFGGSYIEHAEQQYTIRGIGRAQSLDDLGKIVVTTRNGIPTYLNQIATMKLSALPRHGAVMKDGKGETVSGMVIILRGENGDQIIKLVKEKVASLKLPGGARILPFYDQSDVINATTHTVKKNLIEAAFLVIVILLFFLGDWRAALVVAVTIPLSLLFGFLGMGAFRISINLMSLGAIDFGTIVDGSVVMVENCIHRVETGEERPLLEIIRDAAIEVARPVTFGVLIIIAVYLPVLTLESLEGRMFRPMAVTVVSALAGSLFLALFIVPTLCSLALKHKAKQTKEEREKHDEKKPNWFDKLRRHYESALKRSERYSRWIFIVSGVLIVLAIGSLKFIGTEFMPRLDEGSMVITSKRLPGISLTESVVIGQQIERTIKSFPEISSVVTKLGRPDLATEAMGEYESDSYVSFTPKFQEASTSKHKELSDRIEKELEKIPGVSYEFTQPMQMRMDETITGTRGDVALKIFAPKDGGDIDTLEQLGHQANHIIGGVKGAAENQMELISGAEELQIRIDRDAIARYGVNVGDIREFIESLYGGKTVSEMLVGEQRFSIALRLPADVRNDPEQLSAIQMKTPSGNLVRLDQLAEIREVRGPILINRENATRRAVVTSNVDGRDLGSFVVDCKKAVADGMQLPAGYRLEWGGQYENQSRAQQRLAIVFPISILIIAALLYATFRNARQMLLILCIVPLALVGGIAALWITGINLNLSASVGFIALFGIAVLNGVVMVSHINTLRKDGKDLETAVQQGASDRLRPVLITALVASLGFVPMALANSRGAEVQRPLAVVVIGGLVTATLLTLFVLPLLYRRFSPQEIPDTH
ncbi:heavy metal efflux pump, cobalt-zinc-cadmium [Terriglobus roseus DSM 18391]|uniref:Heavy metal efflux pump, cobalt-zinc-cadmium n=1 Tax=Terriglobus roseus (strain DSM 18391 / NRRL B-41598 / KBS 63) TaxID=926566 RepID=I3ZEY2_TERRK|nr:CusA/CzcA family heavy metal efflux RND transporter [Terriglobus roseus]AFL87800.1 heavy metal efflux pump, cobalt-zinc-cadmium [Terriglobus roseus DSM 18391]